MYSVCHNPTHEFGQKWWFGKLLWYQRTRNARGEWFPWDLSTQDVAPWGHITSGPHPDSTWPGVDVTDADSSHDVTGHIK